MCVRVIKKRRISCNSLGKFISSVADYMSIVNRSVFICQRCGAMSAPFLGGVVGPRAGGWKKKKHGKGYICHFCDYHYDYCSKEEIDERAEIMSNANKRIEEKIMFWKMIYPWARVRYR